MIFDLVTASMRYRRFALCILSLIEIVILSVAANATTVPERIVFKNILENKDIAIGEGAAFFQDSQGFMWLGGSNALIRYDGYEFRPIELTEVRPKVIRGRATNTNSQKLPIKMAQHMLEDSHGIIWIATRAGVLRYETRTEKIAKIHDDDAQPMKISTADMRHVMELPSGEILVCSISGLFVINPNTLKYTAIEPNPHKPNWLSGGRVEDSEIDGAGNIWLGTEDGLEKLDWITKTFTLYRIDPEHPDLVANNRITDMAPDKDGNFWIATAHGLVYYNTHNQQSIRYLNDPNDPYSLGGNDIWSVLLDSQGVLWVGSDGGGLSVFDKEHNRFINHKYEAGRVGAINSNSVRAIFEDKIGDIWVGNFPVGINFYDRSSSAIISYTHSLSNSNSISDDRVLSVLEDRDQNLWVGTDGNGLDFLDRRTGNFKHFKHVPDDPTTINGDAVLTSYLDSAGLLWVGVWGGGLASLNPKDMKFTRYPFGQQRKSSESVTTSDRLNSEHAWTIYEDKKNVLWIGLHKGGLSKFDRTTRLFRNYTHVADQPNSIADDLVWNTLEDSNGNFWVGTGGGLCLMDRDNETFKTYAADPKNPNTLSNSSIISIYEDRKKRLWLGTDAGLNLFHPETQTFTVYNKESGLLDDTIRTILEDSDGILWLSTNNGISSFDPDNNKIKNYNRIGGRLIGGFASRSGMVSSRGEIIFGGVNGLRIINPKELGENKAIPPIVFTDFRIFADSVTVGGKDGILKQAINFTDTVRLDYQKSMFVFSFAALNYRDTEKNRYAYKLEGFDENWLDAGDQRVAKYTNLDPGTYVFRVRGSNNDGVWNEDGKSITVIQLTPPWLTWWAFSLYGLIVLSLFAWGMLRQLSKRHEIETQNRILEAKVTERTAEVRERNNDIQIMLSNIPQGLFTVQNNGLIHPAYSQYLESIFETTEIAGRNASDLLFNGAHLVGAALDRAKSAIFAIIGEDELNFILNENLLLSEYEIDIGNTRKCISLDWNPILVNGLVNRLMVSVRDVTQIKQMEDSLLNSEKLAALGALVAGVAHELNTPIGNGLTVTTSLCDSCATIKEQVKTGLTKSALDKFIHDMDEGTHLVNRNLEKASELVSSFKQVAVDRTSAQRRKFSLRELVLETRLTVSPLFRRTPYVVDVEIADDIMLDSYPGPLGQVITNLINNAIIHGFDGREHGLVVLSSKNVSGGVQLTVTDDGLGIPPENQAKIFNPFFTTKLGAGGNGLGMHIVHNIVTGVLGGKINLKSKLGEGTTFTLYLPKIAPANKTHEEDEILH